MVGAWRNLIMQVKWNNQEDLRVALVRVAILANIILKTKENGMMFNKEEFLAKEEEILIS
jgi:hypothetical protein